MWKLLTQAPEKFDSAFLQWVRTTESILGVTFADWDPSGEEKQQIEQLVSVVGHDIPEELRVYYDHAYPFDHIKDGAARWVARSNHYASIWTQRLQHKGLTREQAYLSVSSAPFLWPVDCFRQIDTVAFCTANGRLAVIQIDSLSARTTPVALGLRNYFLAQIALQMLAHETDSKPDWAAKRSDPTIAAIAQWPENDPPLHVCLTV